MESGVQDSDFPVHRWQPGQHPAARLGGAEVIPGLRGCGSHRAVGRVDTQDQQRGEPVVSRALRGRVTCTHCPLGPETWLPGRREAHVPLSEFRHTHPAWRTRTMSPLG